MSFTAHAATITIEAEFDVSVDTDIEEMDQRQIKKDGWTIKKNEYDEEIYVLKLKIPDSKLPLSKSVGPASFSISKTGVVSLGISVGDADASSSASLQLPMLEGKLNPIGVPLILSNDGGDHASGMWQFSGSVSILVTP